MLAAILIVPSGLCVARIFPAIVCVIVIRIASQLDLRVDVRAARDERPQADLLCAEDAVPRTRRHPEAEVPAGVEGHPSGQTIVRLVVGLKHQRALHGPIGYVSQHTRNARRLRVGASPVFRKKANTSTNTSRRRACRFVRNIYHGSDAIGGRVVTFGTYSSKC
jgi:hypothetical protein